MTEEIRLIELPRLSLAQRLDSIVLEMEDPADAVRAREAFICYAEAATNKSELTLETSAGEEIYFAEWGEIVLRAMAFTQLEILFTHSSLGRTRSERPVWHLLKEIDAFVSGVKLAPAQRHQIKDFFHHTHHAGAEYRHDEVIDLAVAEDALLGETAYQSLTSSANCARLLLERLGVEPTDARIHALSRRADGAKLDFQEESVPAEEDKVD